MNMQFCLLERITDFWCQMHFDVYWSVFWYYLHLNLYTGASLIQYFSPLSEHTYTQISITYSKPLARHVLCVTCKSLLSILCRCCCYFFVEMFFFYNLLCICAIQAAINCIHTVMRECATDLTATEQWAGTVINMHKYHIYMKK